jgi:hypothetical protein
MTKKVIISIWGPNDPVITQDDWSELETIAGLTFLPEHRANIGCTIAEYIDRISHRRGSPRSSAVKPLLDEIAVKANDLTAALSKLATDKKIGWGARQALFRQVTSSRHEFLDPRHLDARTIEATVRRLAKVATAASEACADDIGAEGDPYLGDLLLLLHQTYRAAGGKGTYTERSLGFLTRACRLAGAEIQSDAALRQRLKSALVKKSDD